MSDTLGLHSTPPTSTKLDKDKPVYIIDDPTLLAPYTKNIRALVMWDNTLHSGVLLSSITVFVLAIQFFYEEVLNIIFNCLYWVTLMNLILKGARQVIASTVGTETLPNLHLLFASRAQVRITENQVHYIASILLTTANIVLRYIASIILCEHIPTSVVGLAGFYVACFLTLWLSPTSIFLLFTLTAFSVPLFYHQHQEMIDMQIASVGEMANQYLGSGLEALKTMAGNLFSQVSASISGAAATKTKEE